MTWPFTLDESIALGVGVPGSLAAIVAAIFAVRGDCFVRRQATRDAYERDRDIQPRISIDWAGYVAPSTPAPLRLVNAGGAAVRFVWVGQDDQSVAATSGQVPAHPPGALSYNTHDLGRCPYRAARGTTLLIAEDLHERWWDCRTGLRLRTSAETYLTKRMEQVGLAELDDQLRNLHLRSSLPPEATYL